MSNDYKNITNSDEKHEWISKLLDLISTQRQNPGVSQLNRMEEDLTSRLILIPAAEIAVHAGIVHERTKFKNGETNANLHLFLISLHQELKNRLTMKLGNSWGFLLVIVRYQMIPIMVQTL